jgi:replication factor C large subunit
VQDVVADAERLREERAVEHSGGAFEGSFGSQSDDAGDADAVDPDGSEALGDAEKEAEESAGDASEETDDTQAGLTDFG